MRHAESGHSRESERTVAARSVAAGAYQINSQTLADRKVIRHTALSDLTRKSTKWSMMRGMSEWIRSLSFRGEFAIVICAAFGLSLAASIPALWEPEHWLHGGPLLTHASLLRTLTFEVVVGFLLWQFLVLRGWTAARVGLASVHPWRREIVMTPLVGLGLAFAAFVSYAILLIAVGSIWPNLVWQSVPARLQLVASGLPATTVVATALINPVFEELFVCGYVVSSLRDRLGLANAVNVSAGIRVAYHLYQGPLGLLSIAPFALIGAIWFARTRRLAPLIFAHALLDFIGLALASWKLPH